ncbi:uncharacterized protein N7484_008240 [Penicillium longicatenatum]|uniref:uncharacterized protein n=1 Tax=Penicillium longicatenatum TaxID=1561947 RepID=UPI002546990F|nr:uncharacterized protein N7484_008240 [Penicillium longicatenatum]KAJ5634927.1 hypothetical protein N7484_008240 [Penicillium longicatenatum]
MRQAHIGFYETGEEITAGESAVSPSLITENGPFELEAQTKLGTAQREEQSDERNENEHPSKWRLAMIMIALCSSVFCMALDNTIIATAIPRITDQFQALDDVGWYGAAYLLTTSSLQLTFGKLYAFYSVKRVYLTALFIFELGSFVCGITPNSTGLLLGRAVAGMGAAGIFSGAILIISQTVPLHQRPAYMGLVVSMYGIASVAGPLLGGAFTDHVTWRWCFYINLPLGLVTTVFIITFFRTAGKNTKNTMTLQQKLCMMDLEGTAFFVPGIACLLMALQWGGTTYPWRSGRIIALFIVFGVLITSFLLIQRWKQEKATVPPRVFKNRNVWGSALFGAFSGAGFFVMVYYVCHILAAEQIDSKLTVLQTPIWFQSIKGVSAVKSGIMNLPLILSLVIMSIVSGVTVSIVGYYTPFMLLSSILMIVGAGMMSTFEVNSNAAQWIGYQVLFGFGVGCGMQQTIVAVQASLPYADIPVGAAVMMFSQTLGGALGISVAQNVFQNQLVSNFAASQLSGLDPKTVIQAGATQIQTLIPHKFLPVVLTAYNQALTHTFYVSVAVTSLSFFSTLCIEWKSVRGVDIKIAAGA